MKTKQASTRVSPPDAAKALAMAISRKASRSPNFFSVYTNDIQVQSSSWDVRLILGESGDTDLSGDLPVSNINEICEVRMSPQLAKRLTLILGQQLRIYEEAFGEIPAPKEP